MLRRLNVFLYTLWRPRVHPLVVVMVGLCLFLTLGLLNSPLSAQTSTVNQARVTEILDGNQVYIQSNQARVNDLANRGQRVSTGSARTQLSFNTGAIARLSANSVLTVGQCAQLQRGTLLVNGAVNGCTASVTAGVRGTTYLLEVDETGQERVKVLEGEVTVTRQDNPDSEPSAPGDAAGSAPMAPPLSTPAPSEAGGDQVVLTAGQTIATRRGERLGQIQQLTAQDFIDILTGNLFEGFLEQLPGFNRIQDSFQRLFPGIPFPLRAPNLPIPRPRIPFL